jgi:putative addiction module component (TIGR02574 family)
MASTFESTRSLASPRCVTYDLDVTDAAKRLLAEFDKLGEDDQRWLADVIVDRVGRDSEEEVDEAWRNELLRRLEQVERGEANIISAEEVERRLAAILRG